MKISLNTMLPHSHLTFITLCLVQVAFCQRIQLFPYKLKDNCSISLVEENDTILMYGMVDFNGNIPASSVVNFEIKRKTEKSFQFYCVLKVPEDCDKVFNYCNCLKTNDHQLFKLSLHITAFTENSEADARAELVYRETSFLSETRNLPLAYGSKTDLVEVYANDQVVHFKKTDVSINDTQVTIKSVCRKHFAPDCKQQLTDLETGVLLKSGKGMIVYNTNIRDSSNFKLKYSVCNIEINISFSIITDKSTDNLHLTTETNPILSTDSIITLGMMLCFAVFVSLFFAYEKIITQNSTDICYPQETCRLNDCVIDQTDLADLSSLGDVNQDTDPHHFTSDLTKVQSDDVEGPLIGDHEIQVSEGGEADLHKYLIGCKKNPGHRQFIPVATFTLKHLPKGYQDKDLYEYIKVIADQTVRVDVKMTGPHRPKFWPKTHVRYPFSNMSERRNLRTGSGRVWNVNKFQDGHLQYGGYRDTAYTKCWCRKCKDSDSPNNVWWEFNVTTATQLVFDDIEANHTTLRLFYDRDESPVVNVDKVSVVHVNIDDDRCVLKCVTCDTTLGNKLREIDKHFKNVLRKVFYKYKDSRSQLKLNFIVSHPHGCSKQVSVGQWKDILEVDKYRSQFTYTTCTCPGSSGAHVQCLGYNYMIWSELVHSGSKSGLNYSGVGRVY